MPANTFIVDENGSKTTSNLLPNQMVGHLFPIKSKSKKYQVEEKLLKTNVKSVGKS